MACLASWLLGKQSQTWQVSRSHDREVSTIQGRDLVLVEQVARDDDGCVDKSERQVRVPLLELGGASVSAGIEFDEAVRALGNVVQERAPYRTPSNSGARSARSLDHGVVVPPDVWKGTTTP